MKDQTIRAREQAGGLDAWANVLVAHNPDGSAKGILMLRAAAKTLRELASEDAPEGPYRDLAKAAKMLADDVDAWLKEIGIEPDAGDFVLAVTQSSVKVRDALNRLKGEQ